MRITKIVLGCAVLSIIALSVVYAADDQDVERATREVNRSFRKETEAKLEPQPEEPVVSEEQTTKEQPAEAPAFVERIRENLKQLYNKMHKK